MPDHYGPIARSLIPNRCPYTDTEVDGRVTRLEDAVTAHETCPGGVVGCAWLAVTPSERYCQCSTVCNGRVLEPLPVFTNADTAWVWGFIAGYQSGHRDGAGGVAHDVNRHMDPALQPILDRITNAQDSATVVQRLMAEATEATNPQDSEDQQ